MTRPQVVVVGGGFGGLYATRRLARGPVDVTVLDTTGVHTFQPLLYQCATGMLSEGQITAPLRSLFRRHRNVRTLLARAVDLNAQDQTIEALRPDGTTIHVPYDHLIVAIGVEQSYFGHEGFAAHAPGMKTIDDALTIRRRVLDAFEMAESLPTFEERAPWMTFALVGAGPTGVELAGQLRELATHTLTHQFRSLDPAQARVLLYDGGDAPLASFGPVLSRRATDTLQQLGVDLQLHSKVTNIDAHGLDVTDRNGTTSRTQVRTVLWTAGVAAPPFAHALARATGAEQDSSGRIHVQPDLTLPGHPIIHVVGDLAALDNLPGVAEVAMQGGWHAAGQVLHAAAGEPASTPFRYRDLGSAAYISRGHAIVSAGPVRLSGRLGWLAWGLIHITFLTGFRNRAGAILTWMTTLATGKRREMVIPNRDPDTGQTPFTPRIPPGRPEPL
jgi:NADH dehydrogenase